MFAIELRKGRIEDHTWLDALVDPIDTEFQVITGVPRALVDAGGPELEAALAARSPIALGAVAETPPGSLRAKMVLHVAVTGYREEDLQQAFWADTLSSPEIVRGAVGAALERAEALGCETIGFPSLAADVTGFPAELCARAMFEGMFDYLSRQAPTKLRVAVVVLDRHTLPAFERLRTELDGADRAAREAHARLLEKNARRAASTAAERDAAARDHAARDAAERAAAERQRLALEQAAREQAALEAAERDRAAREAAAADETARAALAVRSAHERSVAETLLNADAPPPPGSPALPPRRRTGSPSTSQSAAATGAPIVREAGDVVPVWENDAGQARSESPAGARRRKR